MYATWDDVGGARRGKATEQQPNSAQVGDCDVTRRTYIALVITFASSAPSPQLAPPPLCEGSQRQVVAPRFASGAMAPA